MRDHVQPLTANALARTERGEDISELDFVIRRADPDQNDQGKPAE